MFGRLISIWFFVALAILYCDNSAGAAAPYYEGKSIRIIVGTRPAAVKTPILGFSRVTLVDIFQGIRP